MGVNRRQFLEAAGVTTVGATSLADGTTRPGKLPQRAFGRTGLSVPILGFGSGSRFAMYKDDDEALAALSRAIDLGVTYIDTAHAYSDGQSEARIGRLMPARRKEVILATKLPGRTADEASRQLELSLKRLKTDRLDVLHIHDLKDLDDLSRIESRGAVLETLYKAREQRIVRAIGITCHAHPVALKTALERHDFDCTQMALNAAMARMAPAPGGMKATPTPGGSFEELALPVAVRKGMGIIAMKVFGQDQLLGVIPPDRMIAYALSLPVSLASLGMPRREFIEQNAAAAAAFKPLSPEESRKLRRSVSEAKRVAMERFFRDHRDA
ncbi:General stress protein 69 [Aquisphaera giovannonii]|uniref:General stress protein 69 n=1 Tax=Aquisphaera giovannonii TaxID=406548 RepID=A0A5B9VXX5_9BACT|nr:aldo/keto reductase [Aquisphaera giovannonii]QEH33236.1 General stress protein 69 [Aquisphaera giovannonii]